MVFALMNGIVTSNEVRFAYTMCRICFGYDCQLVSICMESNNLLAAAWIAGW